MFHVGQKVVCVNDTGVRGHHLARMVSSLPVKGGIYTIRGIIPPTWEDSFGLIFEEISGQINPLWGHEYSFLASRFRPLVERKTDISIFTEMLKSADEPVS